MSFLGSALGAVVSTVGSLIGGSMQAHSASKQAELEAKLQRENWEYAQTHAHQFEIQDLKDAGLNPILSANHSQLASMPAVSIPSGPSAYGNLGSNLASAIQASMHNEIEKGKLENDKLRIGIERDRLNLDAERNAAEISFKEKQMDQIDQEMDIALKDFNIRKDLASADIEVKKQAAFELGAKAEEALSHAGLFYTQSKDLSNKIKYGYLIASYLPEEAREFAYSNIVTWVDAHKPMIEKFIEAGVSDNPKASQELVLELFRSVVGDGELGYFNGGKVRGAH